MQSTSQSLDDAAGTRTESPASLPVARKVWRSHFGATASEILDLLDFTRPRSRSLLKPLLESGGVTIDLPTHSSSASQLDEPLRLMPMIGEPPPEPLALYSGDVFIAVISSQDQVDVEAILATGLDLELSLDTNHDLLALQLAQAVSED